MKAAIKHLAYSLPAGGVSNDELAHKFPEWPANKIEDKLGITYRHIARQDQFSSDLAVDAAEDLFHEHPELRSKIDFILFCTQSPDYYLPTTACLIQDRLALSTRCGALDFNLGCSGWVYGLALAKGLVESGMSKALLLLTGETYSKFLHPDDKGTRTLFGDAGSACFIEGFESDSEHIGPFVFGTDGAGAEHLIVQKGGMRKPGRPCGGTNGLCMNGGEIFSFSIREVPNAVENLLFKANLEIKDVDCFIFHQANKYMLEFLRKKCNIPQEKFYLHFETMGNTVSNTIPIALYHAIADKKVLPGMRVMFVGFGVGLSWAACLVRI